LFYCPNGDIFLVDSNDPVQKKTRAECLGRHRCRPFRWTHINFNVNGGVLSSAPEFRWSCTHTRALGDSSLCTCWHAIVVWLVVVCNCFAYLLVSPRPLVMSSGRLCVAWSLDCAAVRGLAQRKRLLCLGRCVAGPAHAGSIGAWGSTERGSSLRLAEGSPGLYLLKLKSRRYRSPSSSLSYTSYSPSLATTDNDDDRVGRKVGSGKLAVLECPEDCFAGVLDYR